MIPLFVAIPLAVAFLLPLAGRGRPAVSDWLANGTMSCLAILALVSIGENGLYHMGAWPTPIGIDLRLDPLAALLLLAINMVGLVACLYSVEYMRRYTAKHRYYSLFLLLVAGMNGAILAGDLFNLYVMMEVAAVASYALVAFGGEHEDLEAAFKYAVLGSLSSAVILIGVGLVYGVTGTLNMAHIADRVSQAGMSPPLLFASALFLCGFGLKAALVPFHAWLPDAHPSAPAPVSAMLSGVLIKAIGIYVLARLIYNVFGVGEGALAMLRWLGVVSIVVGSLLAAGQWDIKRLLAYSSIGQVGYIVLGLGLGTPLGLVRYRRVRHRDTGPEPARRIEPGNAGDGGYVPGRVDVDRGRSAVQRFLEQADHHPGLHPGRLSCICGCSGRHERGDVGLPAQNAACVLWRAAGGIDALTAGTSADGRRDDPPHGRLRGPIVPRAGRLEQPSSGWARRGDVAWRRLLILA